MNSIKCLKCGDIIVSKSRHDFVTCSCGFCFVDGGDDYCRVGGHLHLIKFYEDFDEQDKAKLKGIEND